MKSNREPNASDRDHSLSKRSDTRSGTPTAPIESEELASLVSITANHVTVSSQEEEGSTNETLAASTNETLASVDDEACVSDSSPTPNSLHKVDAESTDAESEHPDELANLLETITQLSADGAYDSALSLCEHLLKRHANHAGLIEHHQQLKQWAADPSAAGEIDLKHVPAVLVAPSHIMWHRLDHRAGFILSRIDGSLTYADLLAVSGMGESETLDILRQLLAEGLIESTSG